MITKRLNPVFVSQEMLDSVAPFNVLKGWDRQTNPVKEFKRYMKRELKDNQENRCGFCERRFLRITPHIDHIAYKEKYLEHIYDPKNLIYSCPFCNGFESKCDEDVVELSEDANYENWKFTIIHPYFDDPTHYISLIGNNNCEIHINDGLSLEEYKKAENYINLFGLDTVEATAIRFMEKSLDKALTEDEIQLAHKASAFRPY